MTDEPINIAAARAERAGDCRLWTPIDAVRDLLARMEAGKIKPFRLAVHYLEGEPDGKQQHGWCAAGVTYPEHVALLALGQHAVLHDWNGDYPAVDTRGINLLRWSLLGGRPCRFSIVFRSRSFSLLAPLVLAL